MGDRSEELDTTTRLWLDMKCFWDCCLQSVNEYEPQDIKQYHKLYNFIQNQLEMLPPLSSSASCGHSVCNAKAQLRQTNEELRARIGALENAQNEIQNFQNTAESSSSDHQTILGFHHSSVVDKVALVARDVASVVDKVALVAKEVESTKLVLAGLASAANETYVSQRSTVVGKSSPPMTGSQKGSGAKKSAFKLSPTKLEELLRWSESGNDQRSNKFSEIPEIKRNLITEFSVYLNNLVCHSQIIPYGIDNCMYQSSIAATVNCILNWRPGQVEFDATAASCYLPMPCGQEIQGVHPIVYAILKTLAKICGTQDNILAELELAEMGQHSKRYIALVLGKEAEFEKPLFPGRLGLVAEVKPVKRKNENFDKLTQQGANQVLGHLAKHLLSAFELGGIGIDKKVQGVVLTLASVEVIELELQGMGSADIQVTKRTSGKLPLFHLDETNSAKLFGDDGLPKSLSASSCSSLPATGFQLLSVLLTFSDEMSGLFPARINLARITSSCFGSDKINLGKCLGSGAFAVVYTVMWDKDNLFVKVPKGNLSAQHLEREVNALKMLKHERIPELMEPHGDHLSKLHVEAHCLSSEQKCLCLTGIVGNPAWVAMRSMGIKEQSSVLEKICSQIMDALDYAHAKNWVHLDIRPANCIVNLCDNVSVINVLLIDWGCAARINDKIGFRGCLPFAHKELLKGDQDHWQAKRDYDLASLAYTIASLSQSRNMEPQPPIPWHHFTKRCVEYTDLLQRDKVAKALLKSCQFDASLLSKLLSFIDGCEHVPKPNHKRKLINEDL